MKPVIHQTKGSDEKQDSNDRRCENDVDLTAYWVLVALRLALSLAPQTGYIHPDEFLQSLEVINGDVFKVVSNRPWEYLSSQPLRSISLPYLVFGAPLVLLKIVAPFFSLWFGVNCITPYTLLVAPRFTTCLISFRTDYSLYKISVLYGQNYRSRLITLGSSYVMLIYGTRTFTNVIEMSLASMLIYIVAHSMVESDEIINQNEYFWDCCDSFDNKTNRIRYHQMRMTIPRRIFTSVFYIASITVMGEFTRPTFLAFAVAPILFWILHGTGSQIMGFSVIALRTLALIVCSVPAIICFTLVDSVYYGSVTIDEIKSANVSALKNAVFTPLNFIRYNMNSNNLVQHGIHSRLTHFLINVPLLFNVLGFAGLFSITSLLHRGMKMQNTSHLRVQSIECLMTTSFILPIILLSLIPHQEARYIIPVIYPLVFLYSERIRNTGDILSTTMPPTRSKDSKVPDTKDGLLTIWYMMNIGMGLFFGFIHQAGVIPLLGHMNSKIAVSSPLTTVHFVTSHVYSLPTSFLFLNLTESHRFHNKSRYQLATSFYNYELGSSISIDHVAMQLDAIVDRAEKLWTEEKLLYRVYYATPSSIIKELQSSCFSQGLNATIEGIFYPHVSTEALPQIASSNFSEILSLRSATNTLFDLAQQMGLALIRVTPLSANKKYNS